MKTAAEKLQEKFQLLFDKEKEMLQKELERLTRLDKTTKTQEKKIRELEDQLWELAEMDGSWRIRL